MMSQVCCHDEMVNPEHAAITLTSPAQNVLSEVVERKLLPPSY